MRRVDVRVAVVLALGLVVGTVQAFAAGPRSTPGPSGDRIAGSVREARVVQSGRRPGRTTALVQGKRW